MLPGRHPRLLRGFAGEEAQLALLALLLASGSRRGPARRTGLVSLYKLFILFLRPRLFIDSCLRPRAARGANMLGLHVSAGSRGTPTNTGGKGVDWGGRDTRAV